MEIVTTPLEGLRIIRPRIFADRRGFFFESYNAHRFAEHGLDYRWVQDNHARSVRGTVRGLHFQRGPGQPKLVRCVRGRIWDVAVDIRPGSPTLGRWFGHELDEDRKDMLLVPAGFAHGYAVLSDEADVLYKCATIYDPQLEDGIDLYDPDLAVQWPIADPILSERDRSNQSFKQYLARTGED